MDNAWGSLQSTSLLSLVMTLLGKGKPTKTYEFSEKFRRGGGAFPIQKFLLQILDFWTGFFWHKNDTKGYFQGMFFNNLKRNLKKKFSWDFVFDSRDHYFWYSRTQGFSKILKEI